MIPKTAPKTTLDPQISTFTSYLPTLHLGGANLLTERRIHSQIFNITSLPSASQPPIGETEFTVLRGPHGSINIRILYPEHPQKHARTGLTPALIYFHGGGYTVGTADEFENGCRVLAQEAGEQVYIVEYRLSPEWQYPTQLDEYEAVIEWLRGQGGRERGVDPDCVMGGGDSAGGNMTAAIKARVPFDTPAAVENNAGPYLVCNGIFEFARNYLPAGVPPSTAYVSPGMQPVSDLKNYPPATVYTCGFDCLRDVGVEFASKLEEAGNQVTWRHYETLSHGFLQMAPWSDAAMDALTQVAQDVRDFVDKFRGD